MTDVVFLESDWTDTMTYPILVLSFCVGTVHIFLLTFAKLAETPLKRLIFYKAVAIYGVCCTRVCMLGATRNFRDSQHMDFLFDYCRFWKTLEILLLGIANSFAFMNGLAYDTMLTAFNSGTDYSLSSFSGGWEYYYFLLTICVVFTGAAMYYADIFLLNATYCLAIGSDQKSNDLFALFLAIVVCVPFIATTCLMIKIWIFNRVSNPDEDIQRMRWNLISKHWSRTKNALFWGVLSFWVMNIMDVIWIIYYPFSPQESFDNRFYLLAAQAASLQNVTDCAVNFRHLILPEMNANLYKHLLDYFFRAFAVLYVCFIVFASIMDYYYNDVSTSISFLELSGTLLCMVILFNLMNKKLYYPKNRKVRIPFTGCRVRVQSILIITSIFLALVYSGFYYAQIMLYVDSYEHPTLISSYSTMQVSVLQPQKFTGFLQGLRPEDAVIVVDGRQTITARPFNLADLADIAGSDADEFDHRPNLQLAVFNFTSDFKNSHSISLYVGGKTLPNPIIAGRLPISLTLSPVGARVTHDEFFLKFVGYTQEYGIQLYEVDRNLGGDEFGRYRQYYSLTHHSEGGQWQTKHFFNVTIEAGLQTSSILVLEQGEERRFGIVNFLTAIVAWSGGVLACFRFMFPNTLPRHFFRKAEGFQNFLDDYVALQISNSRPADTARNSSIHTQRAGFWSKWSPKTLRTEHLQFLQNSWQTYHDAGQKRRFLVPKSALGPEIDSPRETRVTFHEDTNFREESDSGKRLTVGSLHVDRCRTPSNRYEDTESGEFSNTVEVEMTPAAMLVSQIELLERKDGARFSQLNNLSNMSWTNQLSIRTDCTEDTIRSGMKYDYIISSEFERASILEKIEELRSSILEADPPVTERFKILEKIEESVRSLESIRTSNTEHEDSLFNRASILETKEESMRKLESTRTPNTDHEDSPFKRKHEEDCINDLMSPSTAENEITTPKRHPDQTKHEEECINDLMSPSIAENEITIPKRHPDQTPSATSSDRNASESTDITKRSPAKLNSLVRFWSARMKKKSPKPSDSNSPKM